MDEKQFAEWAKEMDAARAEDDAMTPEEWAAWEKLQDETLPEAPPVPTEDDPDAVTAFFISTPRKR